MAAPPINKFGTYVVATVGKKCSIRIRQLDANNLQTNWWNFSTETFEANQPAAFAERSQMQEEHPSTDGFYRADPADTLEGFTGNILVVKYVRDSGDAESLAVATEHETMSITNGLVTNYRPQLLTTLKRVPQSTTWRHNLNGKVDKVFVASSTQLQWFSMDFSETLDEKKLSIDERVAPTVVYDSFLEAATGVVVSLDHRKVYFQDLQLTGGKVLGLTVTCTTNGPALSLIARAEMRVL